MNNLYTKPISRNPEFASMKPVLKVVGMGGGGSNAINRMIELGLKGVEFIAINTDAQALKTNLAPTKIQIGPLVTRGLGAGGNPQVGFEAAKESIEELSDALKGADMVFLTAGMGGGTGTGSIAIAAQAARNVGAVTVAIVTTPFSFEMGRRQRNAQEGLSRLRQHVDTLITIPNDRLLKIAPRDLPLDMAFRLADDVLRQGIQGISELINQTGYINVDFSHIRQLMKAGGGSLLSIGIGKGKDKAKQAVHNALNHPLLESVNIQNASGIIANFTAGEDLSFIEVTEALTHLSEQANTNADIIPGLIMDPKLTDRCEVILVITGLGATPLDTTMSSISKPNHQEEYSTKTSQKYIDKQYREPVEAVVADENLDIPAFLRRRKFQ
jgi:cell division protein FtsZ